MFDVRALPRVGPVAQRLEQGTHNLAFASRKIFRPSHSCERLRTKTATLDTRKVNMVSTARMCASMWADKPSRARLYGQADPSILCYKRRPVLQKGLINPSHL
jgi:hypothetical protein